MWNPSSPKQTMANDITGIGVSLRQPHYAEFLGDSPPTVSWLEVLSDNYLYTHGLLRDKLYRIRERYPMVLHGVGLNIGSADPLSQPYLTALRQLADNLDVAWVSDHLCWTGVAQHYSHDLLPLPLTTDVLTHIESRIQVVQEQLQRPLLLENISTYWQDPNNEFSEADFLNTLTQRTGGFILLDVNNVYVNAHNHGFSAEQYLQTLAPSVVKQIHLAGHERQNTLLIDTHGSAVIEDVWDLYRYALRRFGAVPTNIEWDSNIPAWSVLWQQVEKAQSMFVENKINF